VLLILGPGEHVHINKSRIHAFRKVDFLEELDAKDCHYQLRRDLKEKLLTKLKGDEKLSDNNKCISIAWDWCYQGQSSNGIASELITSVNGHNVTAIVNREKGFQMPILGKPFHNVLSLASTLSREIGGWKIIPPEKLELARGILPVLHWAHTSLKRDEEFIKERNVKIIIDDAKEGIGSTPDNLSYWTCDHCLAELWCFYVQRWGGNTTTNLCISCVEERQLAKNEKNVYRRRTLNLEQRSLGQTIKTLQDRTLLDENGTTGKQYWWNNANGFLSDEVVLEHLESCGEERNKLNKQSKKRRWKKT